MKNGSPFSWPRKSVPPQKADPTGSPRLKEEYENRQRQEPRGGFARGMARGANGIPREGKGVHAAAGPAQPRATRAAVGSRSKRVRLRRAAWKTKPGGAI